MICGDLPTWFKSLYIWHLWKSLSLMLLRHFSSFPLPPLTKPENSFFHLLIDHLHYTFWRPSCQHLGKWNASAVVNGGINAQLGHFYNNHIRQKPHSREFLMGLIEAQGLRGAEGYRPKNFNHPRRKLMAH